jgi:hypothetical protein
VAMLAARRILHLPPWTLGVVGDGGNGGRTGGRADRRTGGRADRRTGGQADRRTEEWRTTRSGSSRRVASATTPGRSLSAFGPWPQRLSRATRGISREPANSLA